MVTAQLNSETSRSPEVITAVAEVLSDAGVTNPLQVAREVLSAALSAVPSFEVTLQRRREQELTEALRQEDALEGEAAWRSRTLRVVLEVLEVLSENGVDASAVLSGIDQESAGLEALVRAAWEVNGERGEGAPAGWSDDMVDEVLEEAEEWFEHYRSVGVEMNDGEPTSGDLWEAPGWESRYRILVPMMLGSVLAPVEMTDREWSEYLYQEVEDLRAIQEELLLRLGPDDLTRAGVEEVNGRYTNLLGE